MHVPMAGMLVTIPIASIPALCPRIPETPPPGAVQEPVGHKPLIAVIGVLTQFARRLYFGEFE
jgi:hypothetical protein